jgi:hypothetical protein
MERLKKENKYLSKAVSTLTIDKAILTFSRKEASNLKNTKTNRMAFR